MNPSFDVDSLFIAALTLLLAVGLVTWAWLTMAQVERQLRSLGGFEGLHFEIWPESPEHAERARWPIPG